MPGPEDFPDHPAPDTPVDHGLPTLAPDAVEQDGGGGIDNVVPTGR